MRHGNLFVISGPSGAGKGTLMKLSLAVPDEEQAQAICGKWQSVSQKVYSLIMDELLGE